jgi:hypothetical protein
VDDQTDDQAVRAAPSATGPRPPTCGAGTRYSIW